MFVAQDKFGGLNLFVSVRPVRNEKTGQWESVSNSKIEINESYFPKLKWDDEPLEVFLNTGYDMANQINHVWAMLKCTQDELNKANEKAMYFATKYEAIKKIVNE